MVQEGYLARHGMGAFSHSLALQILAALLVVWLIRGIVSIYR
jgi:hypothetical protein